MIVVGVVVGVVVYRAGHGDHDNWRDHSQYSDAGIRNQIQVKERELQQKKKELERLKQLMKERFTNYLEEISSNDKELLPSDITWNKEYYMKNPEELERKIKDKIKEKLADDIKKDEENLAAIDDAISRINKLQLKSK
jgi:hypothetical protein